MSLLHSTLARAGGAAWLGVRPLWWLLLAASGVLSAAALWWPSAGLHIAAGPASAAVERAPSGIEAGLGDVRLALALPAAWPRPHWPAVRRDPFAASLPAVPDEVAQVAPDPEPTTPGAAHEPPPAAQPVLPDYRFMGSLVDLNGQTRVFVTLAERHLELQAGQVLPDEYVVETAGPPAIRLRHAQGLAVVEIPWPSSAEPVR